MTLSTLIRKGGLAKVATATPATLATQGAVNAGTVAEVASVAVAKPRDDETDPLIPAAEARRQRVIAMLADDPGLQYAVTTDADADPEAVILALAIRGRATCELRIPRVKYDPFLLLTLIERHGGMVH